jgi:hypothetical protein
VKGKLVLCNPTLIGQAEDGDIRHGVIARRDHDGPLEHAATLL